MKTLLRSPFARSLAVLIILHTVGVLGLLSPWKEWIIILTPINLLISAIILWYNSPQRSDGLFVAMLVLWYVLGFLVEVWGVNSGIIFGEYVYGTVLGPKFSATPLIIGVNWLMLLLATSATLANFRFALSVKVLLTALLMVGLDVMIEPVAVALDFWQWKGGDIPLQNYVAWFITAALLAALQFPLGRVRYFALAPYFLIIQALFFILLRLFY
ncbi:carotenoid biosynthesis protein [Cytophagales bacterium LB-30]|uniref:Carotenoid biosynthesis protein n=1 Tax=Shiella aurantiaca TaxID=3058365 RepID=A0ABT8F5R6_9BACT|nr:carotenoid biosynthesis protein [Shiella aurantiaca]MDN4165795.1 carotenoid biosynthesis protein [Shiella aurantiaca]